MTKAEPTPSRPCCEGHGPYLPTGKFIVSQQNLETKILKAKRAHIAGHGPSRSLTNWPRPRLPPTVSRLVNIERHNAPNPGSHYRELDALLTELRDDHSCIIHHSFIIIHHHSCKPFVFRRGRPKWVFKRRLLTALCDLCYILTHSLTNHCLPTACVHPKHAYLSMTNVFVYCCCRAPWPVRPPSCRGPPTPSSSVSSVWTGR